MAKRFTDITKWKATFLRGLQGAYKLLWLYMNDDCDHAGIWHVDMDVAQVRVGMDMEIDYDEAVEIFGENVVKITDEVWFLPSFIHEQYGELNPENRVHQSVILILKKYRIDYQNYLSLKKSTEIKPLTNPLQGVKIKNKIKNKEQEQKEGVLGETKTDEKTEEFELLEPEVIEELEDEIPEEEPIPADFEIDEEEYAAAVKFFKSQQLFQLAQMKHKITDEQTTTFFRDFFEKKAFSGEIRRYTGQKAMIDHFFNALPFSIATSKRLEKIQTPTNNGTAIKRHSGNSPKNGIITREKTFGKL